MYTDVSSVSLVFTVECTDTEVVVSPQFRQITVIILFNAQSVTGIVVTPVHTISLYSISRVIGRGPLERNPCTTRGGMDRAGEVWRRRGN